MAYTVTYDGEFLFDPYGDDVITDSTVSGEVNAAVYFDFTIESTHRLYDKIEEKAGIVKVYSDKKLLFMGEITDIQEDFYGSKQVSCVDPRDHLNDVLLRPYSTVSGEQPNTAPSSVDGYFQWLVDRYNAGTLNQKFHFQVGVNQGAYLDKNNYIYRSSEQFPSIGSELEDKILDSLGGYLTLTYPEDIPTLNLYADVHQANTQIIDFGVNLIDFTKTTGTNEQYTAIRPEGGTPEKDSDDPNAPDPEPTTIESLGDGVTSVDSDYVKNGDVVYCQSAVNRYGYREYSWTDSDTTDPQDLLEKAIADLKKKIEPKLTIEVKAVDMALFMEGYDHLECGQVARVRSKPHDIDEYLLVSSMDIDLKDPSQTKYTLGQAFDSLTGEQSAFVKSLNSGINSSLDATASIDKALKDQAEKVNQAITDAGNALDTANDAQTAADAAKETADNAQTAADNAQQAADSAQSAAATAQDTANTAQTAANDAAKTATNYLKFDSSGLCVGNMTGTLGYNTLIKSTGVDIRNGSTVLASFESDKIELGKNSNASIIRLCNGAGEISAYTNDYGNGIMLSPGESSIAHNYIALSNNGHIHGYAYTEGVYSEYDIGQNISVYSSGNIVLGEDISNAFPHYQKEFLKFAKQTGGPLLLFSGNLGKGSSFSLDGDFCWDDFRIFGIVIESTITCLGLMDYRGANLYFMNGSDDGSISQCYQGEFAITGAKSGKLVSASRHAWNGTDRDAVQTVSHIYGIC